MKTFKDLIARLAHVASSRFQLFRRKRWRFGWWPFGVEEEYELPFFGSTSPTASPVAAPPHATAPVYAPDGGGLFDFEGAAFAGAAVVSSAAPARAVKLAAVAAVAHKPVTLPVAARMPTAPRPATKLAPSPVKPAAMEAAPVTKVVRRAAKLAPVAMPRFVKVSFKTPSLRTFTMPSTDGWFDWMPRFEPIAFSGRTARRIAVGFGGAVAAVVTLGAFGPIFSRNSQPIEQAVVISTDDDAAVTLASLAVKRDKLPRIGAGAVPARTASAFYLPVAGGVITSTPERHIHRSTPSYDIAPAADGNRAIQAVVDGCVISNLSESKSGGFGNMVDYAINNFTVNADGTCEMDENAKEPTYFFHDAHFETLSRLRPGQAIKAGGYIGKMGRTGSVFSSSGRDPTHLHHGLYWRTGRIGGGLVSCTPIKFNLKVNPLVQFNLRGPGQALPPALVASAAAPRVG